MSELHFRNKNRLNKILRKYKKVSIIGAAKSGVAAAKLFKKNGFDVFLSESTHEE